MSFCNRRFVIAIVVDAIVFAVVGAIVIVVVETIVIAVVVAVVVVIIFSFVNRFLFCFLGFFKDFIPLVMKSICKKLTFKRKLEAGLAQNKLSWHSPDILRLESWSV